MVRTTSTLVKEILGVNYDTKRTPTIQPYIDAASSIVDRLVVTADNMDETLTSTQAELIERWLAAHAYTVMDALYMSKSTLGASGSFLREKSKYLDMAIMLDPTGGLNAILNQQRARGGWLGVTNDEALTYDERMGDPW